MPDIPKIDIRPDHWEIVRSILQKHVPQHAVWAFGSRAKWTAKEYSDLDLAIITDKPLSLDISASLSDDFSESDLTYKVDVVDWATTSESFRKIIERDKVVLQAEGCGSDIKWIEVRLGDACTKIGSGATPRGGGSVYLDAGPIAFIRSQNVRNEGFSKDGLVYLDENMAQGLANVQVQDLDVLLNITGNSVARACQVIEEVLPARVNQHVAIIRTNQQILWPTYLRYFLVSPAMQAHMLGLAAVGATRNALTKGMMESFSIRCPKKVDDQKAIANVLSSLDKKIDLNRRINQTLEIMAQAIFKSWFVDFEPVKAKIAAIAEGRDPLRAAMSAINGKSEAELDALSREQFDQLAATAALFPQKMEESEFGEIPKGWSHKTLAQLTDKIGSGATPRGGKEVYLDEGVALIRSQNVHDSLFVWGGLARISDEAATQLKGVTVQADDVLLNITVASILRTCVVEPSALPARVNQHVAIVRAQAGIPPRFIHLHLLRPDIKSHLFGLNAGASREAITKSHIESLALLTPSPELLGAFQAATSPLFRQAQLFGQQIHILCELRDTCCGSITSDTS